jgi:hypothetical protein
MSPWVYTVDGENIRSSGLVNGRTIRRGAVVVWKWTDSPTMDCLDVCLEVFWLQEWERMIFIPLYIERRTILCPFCAFLLPSDLLYTQISLAYTSLTPLLQLSMSLPCTGSWHSTCQISYPFSGCKIIYILVGTLLCWHTKLSLFYNLNFTEVYINLENNFIH